jgi:hypothetical protein
MAEDLTTYTEVDSPGYLSKNSGRVTLEYLLSSVDVYLYKDFGANYFDKIDLQFSGRISSSSAYEGECSIGFANAVNDVSGWTDKITVRVFRNSVYGTYWVYLTTDTAFNYYQINANTDYYFTLSRAAGSDTATLKIYSDAARTNLLGTLSATSVGTGTKFRYFYPAASCDYGDSSSYFYGYFENFLLNPVVSSGSGQIIGFGW